MFLVAYSEDLERERDGLLVDVVRGLIYPEEDAPDFVAKYVNRHFEAYIGQLKTPFFGRLIEFNESPSEMWTCPGHNGGMFYRRSPVGRVFYEYLGETVFRTDLDNSVVELGDLLVHEGPAREAEDAAAEVFGADRTYFVLNGTSTSNKIATGALVSDGDLVLFDRNSHKSMHHGALVLGGGIPVYLPADRNPQGLIGPIDPGALEEDRIRAAIRDCPLVTDPDRWRARRPFRLAVIEQCSYDGTIYNVRTILDRIGHLCDYVLFDNNVIRILDALVVSKDDAGEVTSAEFDDLTYLPGFLAIDAEVGGLIGPEDVDFIGEEMDPGSAAAVLLVEDLWAASLADAVDRSGGVLLEGARIPRDLFDDAAATLSVAS